MEDDRNCQSWGNCGKRGDKEEVQGLGIKSAKGGDLQ
jgi:hypothetical protein